MATDFMTALRASRLSREMQNRARLAGRSLSATEAAAPYEAAAQTASQRTQQRQTYALQQQQLGLQGQSLAQQKELETARLGQQQGQFEASNLLERDRLQAQMEANQKSLEEQKRITDAEMAAAKKAGTMNWVQTGIEAPFSAYRGYQLLKDLWPSGASTGGGMEAAAAGADAVTPSMFGAGELGGEIIPTAYNPSIGVGAGGVGAGALGGATWESAAATGAGYGGDLAASFGAAGTAEAGGAGAAGGTAGAGAGAGAGLSAYTGPLAVVSLPVMTWAFNQSAKRKRKHAREDWANSEEGKAYSDMHDKATLDWTQNTFLNMSPEERENAVMLELNNNYPLEDPRQVVERSPYGGITQKVVNQFGGLLPQTEEEKYRQMYIDRLKEIEKLRSYRASTLTA